MKNNRLFSLGRHFPKDFASIVAAGAISLGSSSVRAQSADEIAANRPTTNTTVTITISGPNDYPTALGSIPIPLGTPLTDTFTFDLNTLTNFYAGGTDDKKAKARFSLSAPTASTTITTATGGFIVGLPDPGGIYGGSDHIIVGNLSSAAYAISGSARYSSGTLTNLSASLLIGILASKPCLDSSLGGVVGNDGYEISANPATNVTVLAPYYGYPQPALTISSSGVLSWPTNVPGYHPQSRRLGSTNDWKKVDGNLKVVGTNYDFQPFGLQSGDVIRLEFKR
jgi:hypothetical protein